LPPETDLLVLVRKRFAAVSLKRLHLSIWYYQFGNAVKRFLVQPDIFANRSATINRLFLLILCPRIQ